MTVTQSLHPWSLSSPISGRIWTATLTQQSSPGSIASRQIKRLKRERERNSWPNFPRKSFSLCENSREFRTRKWCSNRRRKRDREQRMWIEKGRVVGGIAALGALEEERKGNCKDNNHYHFPLLFTAQPAHITTATHLCLCSHPSQNQEKKKTFTSLLPKIPSAFHNGSLTATLPSRRHLQSYPRPLPGII